MGLTWDDPSLDQVQHRHPDWRCEALDGGRYRAVRDGDGHEVTAADAAELGRLLRMLDAGDAGAAGLRQ